ncbi:MAG: hypothetical protein EOP49_00130 [Sphingobacteriales bacterium]|nr:MAG: hypothetical protein EOP49_00130 [Sphingobacteriales bacterium]
MQQSGNTTYAMLVRRSTGGVGATKLLKVMSGDKIGTQVDYRHFTTNADNSGGIATLASAIAGSLTSTLNTGAAGAGAHSSATGIGNSLEGNSAFGALLQTPASLNSGNNGQEAPAAYLCVLLFDEQFRLDMNSSRIVAVGEASHGTIDQLIGTNAVAVQKNGYAFVYFCNKSDELVYFDNLLLTHSRSQELEETHYYPFGLEMRSISSRRVGEVENMQKFNGAGLNTDLDLHQYEFFYRNYDPQIGRWHGLDTKPNEMFSLYAAMLGNPVRFSDPLGDTVALFRPDGTFWKFQDDGKKTWSGIFFQKSQHTSTYEKNGECYEVLTYSEGQSFQFNDPAVAIQGIKNGVINRIQIGTDAMVEKAMDISGVKGVAKGDGFAYAKREGTAGGKMDYGIAGIRRGDFNKNTLYLRGGNAYDVADWGNYLFGRGTAQLEIELGTVQIGAHYNNFSNGRLRRTDATNYYDFGPGTYGSPGIFDSKSDQQAIINGYVGHPDYNNIMKRYYQSFPKYNPK